MYSAVVTRVEFKQQQCTEFLFCALFVRFYTTYIKVFYNITITKGSYDLICIYQILVYSTIIPRYLLRSIMVLSLPVLWLYSRSDILHHTISGFDTSSASTASLRSGLCV